MTYEHGVVAFRRKGAVRFVGDVNIGELAAGLELEGGDDSDVLVWNELDERVLGLIFTA